MKSQDFFLSSKDEQLQIIIELICTDADTNDINTYRDFYEQNHKCSFEFEKLRYEYSFLKSINLYQAVKLYDVLVDVARNEIIDVIKVDHIHLGQLVLIHETLQVDLGEVLPSLYS